MRTVFAKNLRAFIEREGLRQQDVADRAGVTVTALSGWLNRGVQPRAAVVAQIKESFGLTDDDLFSDQNGLYAQIHGLTDAPAGAMAVKGAEGAFVPVRVLGKVHAGVLDDEEQLDGTVEVPASLLDGHPRAFALLTTGTCMNRVIAQGEVVLVDPDMSPGRGSIVVAETEAYEAIMRRWFRGASKLMLSPDSYDEYDDLVFERGDGSVTVLGVVFWHQAAKELK